MTLALPVRRCRVCDRPLIQRADEQDSAFRQRTSCAQACLGKDAPPVRFPGATVEHYRDAPPRCDRCGGPWKWVRVGLQCAVCPRELIVAAALRAGA